MSSENGHIDDIRIARYLSGEMSIEEMEKFFVDLDQQEGLAQKLQEASKALSEFSDTKFDVEHALQQVLTTAKIEDEISQNEESKPNETWRRSKFKQWMVAASISIIFAAGTLFYFYKNTTSNFLVISSKNEVVTDTLPDGTIVTLNDHSLLKFALNDGSETRKVLMEGEVFFEVTPDSSRPFIVEAEHVTVKVLGTSFLVQDKHKIGKILKSDSTHVIVESGVVTVGHPKIKENIVLTAGERVDFETSKPKLKKRQNLEADHLFWKDRMIVFRKIKLHKVVKKLNELYNVEIELANEEIKNCKISASFKGNSLKEVLDVISLTFNLEVQKSADNKYIISGNACQ